MIQQDTNGLLEVQQVAETELDVLLDIRELLAIIAYDVVLRLGPQHIKPQAAVKIRNLSAALWDEVTDGD